MNEIQLENGKQIHDEMSRVKEVLRRWETASSLNNSGVMIYFQNHPPYEGTRTEWTQVSPETFEIVKALNVSHFTKKLEELQKQFNEL